MTDIKTFLKRSYVVLDGGFGTELQKRGMKPGETSELMNFKMEREVYEVLRSYVEAGSDVISANTFGANRLKLKDSGYTTEEVVDRAMKIAREAVAGTETLVALDIGPIGQLLEPTGTLTFEEAYDIFAEIVEAGRGSADLVVIETMTDLYEVKAALLAVKEHSDLPVFAYMTFEKNGRTFTGCSPSAMALTLEGLGANAIGVNCSLAPSELCEVVTELSENTALPLVIKANAGLPDPVSGVYSVSAEQFAEDYRFFADLGVKVYGGCCGTSPDYIRAIRKMLAENPPRERKLPARIAAVSSYAKTVPIDMPRIIGERINPTGKKLMKEALKNHDVSYLLNQALEQVGAGADILDVNVGLPEIDEREMMIEAIKAIQGITDAPLQIDSTRPDVIEAALRVYNGKPIVNSVNGEEKTLNAILPLVKKYGAAVVGLTLDERGIPPLAEERFAIAERIVKRAEGYGIPREDVYIDCLTLTASAEQKAVMETIRAVRAVKERLGVKTVLGVSNISFGLPNRGLINSTFLSMALESGLDLPILNPNLPAMAGAVFAYRLLANHDKNAAEFIERFGAETSPKPAPTAGAELSLSYAIEKGLRDEAAQITRKTLESTPPMEIISDHLIPALDRAGADFEKGKIFLPQLILSANAAQGCFAVIKENMSRESGSLSKGKVVLATVKGDIHDIGKNIVKTLLENYGYTVIDLGKDVPEQAVVDAAQEHDVKLVGLSALMTTTLGAMERTIRLLRENGLSCKVVVGGAVLTAEYAERIGADFYARDAKETVDVAKKIYG
ncbi:MAG: homocysteine S-methyltransferase family protein [Bacteroides sp.]|nr:homocysteine S-methyltransferase family protein [Eubacterium sp.]MCM1418119.1 homocysteine S-methyltransferase family protein [Roseburia sp.]MCM1462257.1 homocysteine S-methyltransferase family protein [Bacteroides sp.]